MRASLTPDKRLLCLGGWVGHMAGLGVLGTRKVSLPVLEIKQDGQWTYKCNNERHFRENIVAVKN